MVEQIARKLGLYRPSFRGSLFGNDTRGGKLRDFKWLFFSFWLSLSCLSIAQEVSHLTLEDAIEQALLTPSAYSSSYFTEDIAKEGVNQAQNALRPTLEAQVGTIYTSPSLGVTPAGSATLPSFLGANAIAESQALLVLSGQFDTSGLLHATIDRNRALVESSGASREVARLDLVRTVSLAYYTASFTTSRRKSLESLLRITQAFRDNTKDRLVAGEVAKVDLIRSDLQVSTLLDQLEQAKATEATSYQQLCTLIGFELSDPLTLKPLDEFAEGPFLVNLPNTDHSERPEIARIAADVKAAEADLEIAKAELRPKITYSIRSGLLTDSFTGPALQSHLGVQGQILVSFPLFDSGTSRSKQKQAKLRISQLEQERYQALQLYKQQESIALTLLNSARTRRQGLTETLKDARLNLAIAKERYQLGEALITEVIDAQNLLNLQEQAHAQAQFDFLLAKTDLERATGMFQLLEKRTTDVSQ
jgi:outer membrane protein